jgi:hypothetical protein
VLGHPLEVALLSYSSLSFPWFGVIVMMGAVKRLIGIRYVCAALDTPKAGSSCLPCCPSFLLVDLTLSRAKFHSLSAFVFFTSSLSVSPFALTLSTRWSVFRTLQLHFWRGRRVW